MTPHSNKVKVEDIETKQHFNGNLDETKNKKCKALQYTAVHSMVVTTLDCYLKVLGL